MFEDLVRRLLPDLGADLKKKLIAELTSLGKDLVSTQVTKAASRTIVKGIDGVIGAAVKHLGSEEALRFTGAYVSQIQEEIGEFSLALQEYVPHVVAVAQAKKQFGSNSREANEARKGRDTFLALVRAEVADLLRAAVGDTPDD